MRANASYEAVPLLVVKENVNPNIFETDNKQYKVNEKSQEFTPCLNKPYFESIQTNEEILHPKYIDNRVHPNSVKKSHSWIFK